MAESKPREREKEGAGLVGSEGKKLSFVLAKGKRLSGGMRSGEVAVQYLQQVNERLRAERVSA